eukprot:4187551-Pyramimonas_sp.AAC.1
MASPFMASESLHGESIIDPLIKPFQVFTLENSTFPPFLNGQSSTVGRCRIGLRMLLEEVTIHPAWPSPPGRPEKEAEYTAHRTGSWLCSAEPVV